MIPHPSQPHPALAFEVEVAALDDARWEIVYRLAGDIGELSLPGSANPERRDELWKHTCFEAFFMLADGHYEEFNLAPSGQWAAYGFDGYRSGMRNTDVPAPKIEVEVAPDRLTLTALITLESRAAPSALGLTTVIEERDNRISWWSADHPGAEPDFHNPRGWVIDL